MVLISPHLPFNQKKRLLVVQVGAVLSACLLIVTKPVWGDELALHDFIEFVGAGLVIVCMMGRLWSTLYIGGRKNGVLVTDGPFSMTRNPLYFFSTVGAVGIGLMFGSVLVAMALGLLTYQIFRITAQKEAAFLSQKFTVAYADYARDTPIFWPSLHHYRDAADVTFSTLALRRTFFDGLYFLAIFPLIELLERLQETGFIPVLFKVY